MPTILLGLHLPWTWGSSTRPLPLKSSKIQVVLIFRELAVEGSSHKLLVPEAREMNGRAGQISWAWAAHALPLGAASQLQAKAAMLESGLIAQFSGEIRISMFT